MGRNVLVEKFVGVKIFAMWVPSDEWMENSNVYKHMRKHGIGGLWGIPPKVVLRL